MGVCMYIRSKMEKKQQRKEEKIHFNWYSSEITDREIRIYKQEREREREREKTEMK